MIVEQVEETFWSEKQSIMCYDCVYGFEEFNEVSNKYEVACKKKHQICRSHCCKDFINKYFDED